MTLVEAAAPEQPEAVEADAVEAPEVPAARISEEIGNTADLKRKSKVAAFTPLPGVPEGTVGLVALVNGWDPWVRYHVLFENGVSLGSINRPHLCPAKQYDEFAAKRAEALASGVFDEPEVAASDDAGGEAAEGGGADGAVVNGVTVPQHLLDRAKAARERLGG